MQLIGSVAILLASLTLALADSHPKLLFTSCALPGWSCVNATDGLSSSIASVTHTCSPTSVEKTRLAYRPTTNTRVRTRGYNSYYETETESYYETYTETTGERGNYTLTLSDWDKLPLSSINIIGCGEIVLNMHTVSPMKIHTLRIEDVGKLVINKPNAEQQNHPRNVVLKKIDYIPVIPAGFLVHPDTKKVEIAQTTIGLIKTKAISLKSPIESFEWTVVTTKDMRAKSIAVKMEEETQFHIRDSTFPFLRTASILVEGGETLIEGSRFNMIQHASIRIYSEFVKLSKNQFINHQGHIFIVSHDVSIVGNRFDNSEPGNLIKWTTHTSSDAPDQVTFTFNENTIDLPKTAQPTADDFGSLEECFSRTTFIEKTSNCSEARTEPSGPWMYNLPRNLTVSNLVVCGNQCTIKSRTSRPDKTCQIPSSWNIVNVWPQPICHIETQTPKSVVAAPTTAWPTVMLAQQQALTTPADDTVEIMDMDDIDD